MMAGRQNNQATLLDAKHALLGPGGRDADQPAQRLVDSASQAVRTHPAACLAGAAAVGVVVGSQPWARRLLFRTARKAIGLVVMKVLAGDLQHRQPGR